MDFGLTPRTEDYLRRIRAFIRERVTPLEEAHVARIAAGEAGSDWTRWSIDPAFEAAKRSAKAEGLWNFFLSDLEGGPGLTNVEYAVLAEEMGRSFIAAEVFNCSAPDTGNMEVLHKYGSEEQKARWLQPLLDGTIRSAFCMTEPDVASSDATNMQATAIVEGDEVVLNGRKWWATGIGHPNCRVAIFMGLSDPEAPRHARHSMVLVPLDTPGVKIKRMLPVFGEYEMPNGHGEVHFDTVRLPVSAIIKGVGRGFEIAQGRLGPGRIHHCMRCIGASEVALDMLIRRGLSRVAFGKPLLDLGANRERIADLRTRIDQARLLTLYAGWKIDQVGALAALTEISAIKVVAPAVLQDVVDVGIQIHGAAGVAYETTLPLLYAQARLLRIADGPDEVHRGQIAKQEIARVRERAADQGL